MSTGYKFSNISLLNFLQPFFSGSELQELQGIKINGVQAFARRDNNPNNAPTIFNTGYKYNGVDIAQFANKANASLTIQITGSKTYNGQGQQANIILISPTNSWITVQTSTVTDAGLYDSNYFSFTPPTGYNNLTVNPSTFSIIPSEINLIPNGGPTSFTWTGSPITFTSYSVSGVFSADTGWSVSDTVRTEVGSFFAFLSTSSQNYVLGTLQFINWTIVPSSVPGPPIIGASSAGDKSFTANWSAPTVTGGQITGYKVSFSTNGGASWSAEQTTTNLSYTWLGNGVIFNGNQYIARVRAYNSLGDGQYSGNPSPVIPTFAAPTVQSINFATPSTSLPFIRPFTVTFTPTPCLNYSYTLVWVQNTTLESPFVLGFYRDVNSIQNNPLTFTSITGQQTTASIQNIYADTFASGIGYFNNGTSSVFSVYVETFNNDGFSVRSGTLQGTSAPTQSTFTFNPNPVTTANAIQLYSAGRADATANGSSAIAPGSITSSDWNVVKLNVGARLNTLTSSIAICASSRFFLLDYSFLTTGTYTQVFNGNQTPFNAANSGNQTTRNTDVDISDTGFGGGSNTGRVRVRGSGTFTTGSQIQVTTVCFGQTRTQVFF